MKKVLIFVLLILCCSGFVFGGELEDTLKKAEQGDAAAQYNLGLIYNNGQRVPKDYKQAVYWYTKSAAQGNAAAQFNLGFMYFNGEGVSQNNEKTVYWWTKSAEQGNADAQFNLGVMYDIGGVTLNYKLAYAWFRLVAAQRYKDATENK
jgi:hypothetical protein